MRFTMDGYTDLALFSEALQDEFGPSIPSDGRVLIVRVLQMALTAAGDDLPRHQQEMELFSGITGIVHCAEEDDLLLEEPSP